VAIWWQFVECIKIQMVEEKIGILSPGKYQWPLAHCAIFFLRIDLLLHTMQFIVLLHTVPLSPF
jgi:hypothetical protein